MTSPLRGAQEHRRRRLRRRSSPVRAAQGTGPPLRPPGCCASRWRATALRAALDPGDHCGPWGQEERQAQACPRAARGTQNPAVADVREHPNPQGTDELASRTHKEENLRYRSQTLESVKHHLKPNRQRSVGPRHRGCTAAAVHGPPPGSLRAGSPDGPSLYRVPAHTLGHDYRCRLPAPWTGSWTGASGNPSAASAIGAVIRITCAASVPGAPGRASHNPPVVGSSPTRPT